MFYQGITADGLAMLAEEDPLENGIFNYPQSLVLVPRGTDDYSVVLGPHIRGSRLRASAAGDEEVDLLLPGTARLQIQLGVNMPARAELIPEKEETQMFHEAYDVVLLQIQLGVNMPARAELIPEKEETQMFHEAYDVVLYLGIIDILQDYNMTLLGIHSKGVHPEFHKLKFWSTLVGLIDTLSQGVAKGENSFRARLIGQEENMELFMVVAWFIWSRRNKMHFNEQHMPPEKILKATTALLADFHGNNDSKPERNLVRT
nr:phosphatidylinositol 4-phosphate 5-kinase 9 [Quercus suber]